MTGSYEVFHQLPAVGTPFVAPRTVHRGILRLQRLCGKISLAGGHGHMHAYIESGDNLIFAFYRLERRRSGFTPMTGLLLRHIEACTMVELEG